MENWVQALSYETKVAGFRRFHPSGRAMDLGSTQPLTEGGKGGPCVWLTTLIPSCADCLEILTGSTSLNPKGL